MICDSCLSLCISLARLHRIGVIEYMFLDELLEWWIRNQGVLVNKLTEFGSLVWHTIVIVITVSCAVYLGALHASKLLLVYIVVFTWLSSWLLYTTHAPLGRSSCAVEDVSNLHLEQPFGKITLRDMLPLLPQDGTVRFAREYSTLAWHWCIPNCSEMGIAILLIKKVQWKTASLQDQFPSQAFHLWVMFPGTMMVDYWRKVGTNLSIPSNLCVGSCSQTSEYSYNAGSEDAWFPVLNMFPLLTSLADPSE